MAVAGVANLQPLSSNAAVVFKPSCINLELPLSLYSSTPFLRCVLKHNQSHARTDLCPGCTGMHSTCINSV